MSKVEEKEKRDHGMMNGLEYDKETLETDGGLT
jgi:hypothetical protein